MSAAPSPWRPGVIKRVVSAARPTASQVVVVETDQGDGYLKAMGNTAGTHSLAVELVATRLARWFRLSTLTAAIIQVTNVPPIELQDNPRRLATVGPAFITRAELGVSWSGDSAELDMLDNPQDLARVVVFDTWVRNCDRHIPRNGSAHVNLDNVFLSTEGASPGRFILKPIDHAQCFCFATTLTPELLRAGGAVLDDRLYGYFPEFRGRVSEQDVRGAIAQAATLSRAAAEAMFDGIPPEWDIGEQVRIAWCDFICDRAAYIEREADRLCLLL